MSDLLSVKFTASNAVRGKRPYTIYEIEVRSSSTMPWLLYKRYRDFDTLHAQVQKIVATSKELENLKFNLPPKRLVRSMAPDVVAKRQKALEEYLQKLLRNHILVRNQIILDFLTVPESLRAMLMRRKPQPQDDNDDNGNKHGKSGRKSQSYSFSGSEEERETCVLIKELALQKNRVRALSRFEKWYFENTPSMRPDLIKKLMTGDETHQGLVHSCRLLHSKVAWRGSISLLVRLLDIERNKHARIFCEVFLTLQQGLYKEMDLHRHIMDASQENGFKIVALIMDNLPSLDHKFYVPDEEAWRQFEKWQKIQNDNFNIVYQSMAANDQSSLQMKNNLDLEHYKLYNWNAMEYLEISDQIFKSFRELSAESDEFYKKVPYIQNKSLKVRYKKDVKSREWKLKITFAVNHAPEQVYRFLSDQYVDFDMKDETVQGNWNSKVIQQRVHRCLDKSHYILHQTYKSFNSPYQFRDFVLLTCLRQDVKAKRYMIVFSSITNYDDIPAIKGKDRAIMLPSGFEIRPTKENVKRSHVSFRARMTDQSVLTVSADLLGETDELFQSMLRIEKLIAEQQALASSDMD